MVTLPKDSLFVCVSRLVHWSVVCEQAVGAKSVCKESGGSGEMNFGLVHATTSCKRTWDTVPFFGINRLSMILCLWSPLHPLSKLLAIQDHTQNLKEQLWMGGRRELSIIFYRPVIRSDLKQERLFFRGSVSTFSQLVVATACPNGKLLNWLSFHPGGNCLLNFLSSFHWPNPPPPPHPLQTLHLIKGCIVIVEPGSPWLY